MFCCFLSLLCTAQKVRSEKGSGSKIASMDTIKIMYAHVRLIEKDEGFLGVVDAGDGTAWAILNAEGKVFKAFKSPNQLFNFMHDNQWDYVDTIENVTSTGAVGQILFGVNIAKTKFTYVFKRRTD
jgi:hypothetical protein